ncbi:MAG: DUF364 domain-containing protein [Deltaproteobacteria bacterium]|nr:DUF364 domain-containing protein [Deltaproteobacteria bacterium]
MKKLTTPKDKWAFYQTLIDSVSKTALVADYFAGRHWLLIKSDQGGIGLAHCINVDSKPIGALASIPILGQRLCDLSKLVCSWDLSLASVGLAAINASLTVDFQSGNFDSKLQHGNAFDLFQQNVKGRKVAVIGHFPHLDKLSSLALRFTIFERQPLAGDLPDMASEYLLPEQDVVFMTGSSIINKTAPRLLELARNAETYLVGPSVPLCPELFQYGIKVLSGTIALDYDSLAKDVETCGTIHFNKTLTKQVNLIG